MDSVRNLPFATVNFANRSRIHRVIAMVRVASFFDSQCRTLACDRHTDRDKDE